MSTFILAALRTPVGAFGGALRAFSAQDLAAPLLATLLQDAEGEPPEGLLLGQAVQAGCGPSPAAALSQRAGLPPGTRALTLNQGTLSGMAVLHLAAELLETGPGGRMLAGGMESSSQAPFLLPSARWGTRMGEAPVLDALIQDGQPWEPHLLDPEAVALAQRSRRLAEKAQEDGWLARECQPMDLPGRRGPEPFAMDEALGHPQGHPAGGAPPGDGAALLLLAAGNALGSRTPLARIRGAVQDRDSASAIQRLLRQARLRLADVDRFELDEAAPAHLLSLFSRFPDLDPERVNLRGGALALGHPLGAHGARMAGSLAHQLRDHDLQFGLAVLEGPGCAMALLLEHP